MGREDEIRSLAYALWEKGGRQERRDYAYWLKAESIWEQQHRKDPDKYTGPKSKPAAEQKTRGKRATVR